METSRNAFLDTYQWTFKRIRELTKDVKVNNNHYDFRCVEDANAIREEFNEWLEAKSRKQKNNIDVLYLEYIGEGSDYD